MNKFTKGISLLFLIIIGLSPSIVLAERDVFYSGTVVEMYETTDPAFVNPTIQYRAKIKTKTGIVDAENSLGELSIGDKVIIKHDQISDVESSEIEDYYSIYERDRRIPLIVLLTVFIVSVLLLGVKQGIRALSALAGTMFVIFSLYIPSLLAGYSPIIISIVLGLLVAGCAVLITHGLRRTTIVAYISTLLSVLVAVTIAWITIKASGLVGVTSDEVVFLTTISNQNLDLAGIMIGGVIITMLGVLDDIAITQVAVVEELKKSNPQAHFNELYKSALRVGRDHAGALVNTLVLAYAGTSLPLLMLVTRLDLPLLITINQESFSFEIIRSISGSIGLIACVPLATLLAILFVKAPCRHGKTTDGCPHCMSKLHSKNEATH